MRSATRVVCHLIASNFPGGPEKQIVEHCARLDPARWKPLVGSFREGRENVGVIERARDKGLATFLIDTKSPFSPLAAWQLRGYLTSFRVHILVTHGYKANLVGYLATRWSQVKQIPYVRGYTAEDWRIRRYEEVDRWLLRQFPRILCVSKGTQRNLIKRGIRDNVLSVVHNAVNSELAADVAPADLRREFGIQPKAKVLVAAGRLSPEKGHRFLISALGFLQGFQPPPHLVILGAGKEELRLREHAQALGLSHNVVLAGFRDNILSYLAGADLLVNPSLTEGFPNVLLEALSVATPIIATDVGGVSEIMKLEENGWLVPPSDPQAMATAIQQALENPTKAVAMGENGRRLVSGSFSFGQQAQKLMTHYDRELRPRDSMDSSHRSPGYRPRRGCR